MKDSVGVFLEGRPHVYRFALYGGTGSGKTCLLAALNLIRDPSPEGLDCQRLTVLPGVPEPKGPRETWDIEKDPVAAFYAGNETLGAAEAAINSGTLPEPTDKEPPFRMLYEFVIPGRTSVYVELLDYAGELTNPKNLNKDRFANLLRKQLRDLDGIFVLVAAPAPGRDQDEQPEALRMIQESLALLKVKDDRRPAGIVGVIIGKWDRRGLPSTDAATRRLEVQEFLNGSPEPRIRRVINAVRGSVKESNWMEFAASAFGPAREEDFSRPDGMPGKRELPRDYTHLHAYGLENPFAWAIQRRDELALEEYRRGLESRKFLARWFNPARPRVPWRNLARARKLCKQLPLDSEHRPEVSRARFGHAFAGVSRAASLLFVLLVGVLLGEALALDHPAARRARAVLADASAPKERRDWAEGWLQDYGTSGTHRHALSGLLVLTRGEALQHYHRSVADRDEQMGKQIEENAGDLQTQAQIAAVYLEYYPERGKYTVLARQVVGKAADERDWGPVKNAGADEKAALARLYLEKRQGGLHAAEAQAVIDRDGLLKKEAENARLLADLEARVGKAIARGGDDERSLRNLDALRKEAEKLLRAPHPDAWPKTLVERQGRLIATIGTHEVKVAENKGAMKREQNLKAVTRAQDRVRIAKTVDGLALVEADVKKDDFLPHPDDATEEVKGRMKELNDSLLQARERLERHAKLKQGYDDAVDKKDMVAAAAALKAGDDGSDYWRELVANFSANIVETIRAKSALETKDKNWEEAVKILEAVRKDEKVIALLSDAKHSEIRALAEKTKNDYGKYLYEEFLANKTVAKLERFLDAENANRGQVGVAATRYLAYLKGIASELEVTVKLKRVDWGEWGDNYDGVQLRLDKVVVDAAKREIQTPFLVVKSGLTTRKRGASTDVASQKIRANVKETLDLRVRLWGYPYPRGTKDRDYDEAGGEKKQPCSLLDCRNGKQWELEDWAADGKVNPAWGAKVTIEVEGIPPEPVLPPWKE